MLQISAHQLAELLIGIARAQAALLQGIESAMPGTRSTHAVPAIQNVAHLRDHPQPTLIDLPVRVLLSHMGRVGPDPATVARDLERLLASTDTQVVAGAAVAGAPGEALDFSVPPKS